MNKNEPLGLPDGSVRAILALTMVIGGFYCFISQRATFGEMMAIAGIPIAFYFGQYSDKPGSRDKG